jgi:NADH-quinone oxidoreductase subunit E
MSVRRLAAEQPEGFAFTPENLEWAKAQIEKYPEGRQASAVLPILWRAQEQMGGWLPEPALRCVADMLGMAQIRIYEIATFYTMFNLAPVGQHYVQVCGTTPCWLRGANAIKDTCRKLIGEQGHVTKDGLFSWTEVECLGACVNAPVAQINNDYYEDLTPQSLTKILRDLKAGRQVKPGPQNGRQASAPLGGPITLIDPELYRNGPPEEIAATPSGPALTDEEAKRPGKAANVRERPVPKPPLAKGRKSKSKTKPK